MRTRPLGILRHVRNCLGQLEIQPQQIGRDDNFGVKFRAISSVDRRSDGLHPFHALNAGHCRGLCGRQDLWIWVFSPRLSTPTLFPGCPRHDPYMWLSCNLSCPGGGSGFRDVAGLEGIVLAFVLNG